MLWQRILALVTATGEPLSFSHTVPFTPKTVKKKKKKWADRERAVPREPCQHKQWPASGGARRGSIGCSVSAAGSGFHTRHIWLCPGRAKRGRSPGCRLARASSVSKAAARRGGRRRWTDVASRLRMWRRWRRRNVVELILQPRSASPRR